MIRQFGRRRRLDRVLDWTRFHIDTFPRRGPLSRRSFVGYQPLPWVGIVGGRRAEGSRTRWLRISETLDRLGDVRTALDVGANCGFFTISLAQRGVIAVAVESDPVAYRTALYAIAHSGLGERASVLTLDVAPATVGALPRVDATLFLSVWHHLVRAYGLEAADGIVTGVWEQTRRVLFFDTGENEITSDFGLPRMEPDARTWLEEYLLRVCPGGSLEHLGVHQAFDPLLRPARRNLFAVVRD